MRRAPALLAVMLAVVAVVSGASPAEAFSYSTGTVHPVYPAYTFNGSDWVRYEQRTGTTYYWEEWGFIEGTSPPPGGGWEPQLHVNWFANPWGHTECPWAIDCGSGHAPPASGGTYVGHSTSWQRLVSDTYSYTETISCGSPCWTAVTPTAPSDPTPPRLPSPSPMPGFQPPQPPPWSELDPEDFDMDDFGSRPRVTMLDEQQDFPMELGWTARAVGSLPFSAQGSSRPGVLAQEAPVLTCGFYFSCDDPSIWSVDEFGRSDWEVRPRPVSGGQSLSGRVTLSGVGDYVECGSASQLSCDFFVLDPRMTSAVDMLGALPTLQALLFSPPPDMESGLTARLDTTVSRVEIWQWRPKTEFVPSGDPCVPSAEGCIIPGEYVEVPGEQVAELNSIQSVPSRLMITLPDGSFFGAAGSGSPLRIPVVGTVGR